MTADAIQVVKLLFSTIWSLFTSWHIPGTNVSPAAWFMFILFAVFVLRVIRRFLDLNGDDLAGGGSGRDAVVRPARTYKRYKK